MSDSEITESLTRTVDAQALLTHQFRGKPVADALVALFSDESQTLESAAVEMRDAFLIDTATGAQLDELGDLVGEPRQGRTDDRYRTWIKARIRVNRSSGSPVDMYAVAKLVLGADTPLLLRQLPVGHVMEVLSLVDGVDYFDIQEILQETSSAGVPLGLQYPAPGPDEAFTFREGGTFPESFTVLGFDEARLVSYLDTAAAPDFDLDTYFGSRVVDVIDFSALPTAGTLSTLSGREFDGTAVGTPSVTLDDYQNYYSSLTFGLSARYDAETPPAGLVSVLGGGAAVTVAWLGSRSSASGAVTNAALQGFSAGERITFCVQSGKMCIWLTEGAHTYLYGPDVLDTDPHVFVASYDGSGGAVFWLDGAKTADSGTHRSPTITEVKIGGGENLATASHWGTLSGKMVILSGAVSDDEAQALTQYLCSFADIYEA